MKAHFATCGQQCRRQSAPVGWLSCWREIETSTWPLWLQRTSVAKLKVASRDCKASFLYNQSRLNWLSFSQRIWNPPRRKIPSASCHQLRMPRSQLLASAKHSGWSSASGRGKREANGRQNAGCAVKEMEYGILQPPRLAAETTFATCTASLQPPNSLGTGLQPPTPNLDPVSGATLHFLRPRPPVTAVRHPGRFQKHHYCRLEFAQTANNAELVSKALVVGVHLPSSCLVTQPSHATGHTRHNLKAGRRER